MLHCYNYRLPSKPHHVSPIHLDFQPFIDDDFTISSHGKAEPISLPPTNKPPSMFSHNRYEYSRPFQHATLICLSLTFLFTLILLILSLYYYEHIISLPTFIPATINFA